MIDQILYYYHEHLMTSNPIGKVLNVGLGQGYTARLLLDKRSVQSVTSIEIDQAVADAYTAAYQDALESRHTIIVGDAASVQIQGKFDLVYIDILTAIEEEVYDAVKSVFQNLAQNTASGTDIIVEFQTDSVIERGLKEWLEARTTKTVLRPALSPFARGRAGAMIVYTRP